MSATGASPTIVVVMGVSGSGKSTVGRLLADDLGCPFFDADTFHSAESIAKMQAGVPLTEQDRLPWLGRIAAKIDALREGRQSAVIGCSALKRRYRDILIGGRTGIALVYLKGSFELILGRVQARQDHFMPASLLQSQFEALEEPASDEHAIVVDVAPPPEEIVRAVREALTTRESGATARDTAKRRAAERAVAAVEDGMVLGLGSGSTAAMALEALARRVAQGLKVSGIPTSERTAALARRLGIPLTDFDRHSRIDLTIDGADQIERGTLNLIKGLGGALLREKIVAAASDRMIVIADDSKLVSKLGPATPLPVEIAAFGWQTVLQRLEELGCSCTLRRSGLTDTGAAFVTDGGNYVADCRFETIADAAALQAALSGIAGVIGTGLFIGMASAAILGSSDGVVELAR